MGVQRAIGRLARGLIPQAVILLYHRVAVVSSDPQLLCVTPENFAGHMEVLRSCYRPCSLSSIARRKICPPLCVAVTFDDGYADNLLSAKPVLQQHQVPATVFVSTGFIGTGRQPYWDQLRRVLLHAPSLPTRLILTHEGITKSWNIGDEPPSDPGWNVLQPCMLERQQAYITLCDHLRRLTPKRRSQFMSELRQWSGCGEVVDDADRFLTPEELRLLAKDGLVDIGAHTRNHPDLALLSEMEQTDEIVLGRERLEEICRQKVAGFAYPYGNAASYTAGTSKIVREAGFDWACSNFAGKVRIGADRYQLPRMLVRNWTPDEFAKKLSGYFR